MNVYDRERIFREALERIKIGKYASNWSPGWVAGVALEKADGPPLRCRHCPHDIDGHRVKDQLPPGKCFYEVNNAWCECPGFEER